MSFVSSSIKALALMALFVAVIIGCMALWVLASATLGPVL